MRNLLPRLRKSPVKPMKARIAGTTGISGEQEADRGIKACAVLSGENSTQNKAAAHAMKIPSASFDVI